MDSTPLRQRAHRTVSVEHWAESTCWSFRSKPLSNVLTLPHGESLKVRLREAVARLLFPFILR
eukprot:3607660-Pleurochrysis_carterae.AAC.2